MNQRIDWSLWKSLGTVKLWQACALLVGVNPDSLEQHTQTWTFGAGSGPIFRARSFQDCDIKEKFEKALRVAENATREGAYGSIKPVGNHHAFCIKEKEVLLSEVVAFFQSCGWPNVPEMLKSISRSAPSVGDIAPAEPVPAPPQAIATLAPVVAEQPETKEQRQARRYQQGVEAGLVMPTNDYTPMPRGIGALAKKEKPKPITRQAYVEDVKAHINRTFTH